MSSRVPFRTMALLWLLLIVGVGCSKDEPQQSVSLAGATMGTSFSVRFVGGGTADEQVEWETRVQGCLDDINARMSTYQPDSEISRFNRSTATDWFAVSPDVAEVVSVSLEISEKTGGAFDITVSPLVNLWSFGPDRRPEGIPTDEEIATAQTTVGYERLQVRLDPPAIRKAIPELGIDLSAIAKGYAVDRVGELLEQAGVDAYMVEVGGEVRTRGRKLDGSPWRIGLEQPIIGKRQLQNVLQLEDHCLATSGDYRIGYEWEGRWYSHEIDPETGRPAASGVAAVSVLGASVMLADAYATAFMVMPPEDGGRLAKELGLEIMLTVRRSDGESTNTITPGFADLLLNMVP